MYGTMLGVKGMQNVVTFIYRIVFIDHQIYKLFIALLYAHKNLKNMEATMNNELQKLNSWLSANKLTLNIKKSNFILFRPYQKKVTSKINIRIFDNFQNNFVSLENKEYVKYLDY